MSYSSVFTKKTLAWVGFFTLTSIIWRGPAIADPSKISSDLLPVAFAKASSGMSAFSTGEPQRVIVQTKGRPSSGVKNRIGILGGRVKRSFENIDSFAAEVPASRLLQLSDDPTVARISPDYAVGACFENGAEAVGGDSASVATYGADGTGITVAVIDSGYAVHPDIPLGQIEAWKDFINNRIYPYDDCGHGTHVAGVIAGNGKMSSGAFYTKTFKGIAPKAKLVVAKVLDEKGSGYTSDVISAIDWVISIAEAKHVRVINLSLGHPVTESYATDPLCQAVERAVAAKIVVVCSAGNAGPQYGTISSPANDPAVITVGATRTNETTYRSDDTTFYYSSRGPSRIDYVAKPDIVAPGNNIISLRAKGSYLDVNCPGNRVAVSDYTIFPFLQDPSYFVMSGTSVAAPMTAAAAALICQKSPKLNPNAVKAILMYSASKMNGIDPLNLFGDSKDYDPMTIGSGYLNIPGALSVTRNLDTGKAVGQYWARGLTAGFNFIGAEMVNWSKDIQWGNYSVNGNILDYNDINWNDGLWGVSSDWVGTANYGSNIVETWASVWQSNWAENPAENADAQVNGDNAIWGGRGMF